jgi:hypothetical protein
MTSIRKFAYAAVLAVAALTLSPTSVSAQEPAHGRFTLTHEVRWANAKVPAGEYEFSYDTAGISPVLRLSKVSGNHAGYMLLVPTSEATVTSVAVSRLLLETCSEGSYVSAMLLPEFGMTLHFNVPTRAPEKQVAKAAATASAPGQ